MLSRVTGGRHKTLNYVDAGGPRYGGNHVVAGAPAPSDGGLDVVTLNLEFGRRVDRARKLFDDIDELARANIILLQEMDAEGTAALAAHLGMSFVYYPATVHPRTRRDFGNAVLSRWPIAGDRKINLPHLSLLDGSQRAATCATVITPVGPVEVCSIHVATMIELLPRARRDQVRAASSHFRGAPRVVLGGDFNSHGLGHLLTADAFEWPTKDIGPTARYFSVDHIFARGLSAIRTGKVPGTLGATDHVAVWTKLLWR